MAKLTYMDKKQIKMEAAGHVYMAIDLKSFYATVECVEREHLESLLK